MTVTVDNIKYNAGAATPLALTWTALGNSATVGRQCTPISNAADLFVDAELTVTLLTNASAPTGDKACYLYFFGSEDGTNYDHDDAAIGAADAGYTINTATNLVGPVTISMPTASKTYHKVIKSVAGVFGGVLPNKWGFVLINQTGNALLATTTNTQPTYQGITYTNT